jgi:hypothetical protein
MKRLLIVLVLALVVAGSLLSSVSQGALGRALERIYKEYSSSRGQLNVSRLVLLDQELRRLLPLWTWEGPPALSKNYRSEYETIGVTPMLFEPDSLAYSGKLLLEAHKRDPKIRRSYTLYSTVFGEEEEGGMPSPQAAKAYLQEFPSGPFAFRAHLALANFYSDLFQVIREEEAGVARDYKYDCYQKYIVKGPLVPQRTDTQAQAVEHYLAVTRLMPKVKELAEWLAEMRTGKINGWHYCAD